ncbi:protein O-mannosyl-transferase Tmtc3-like isoform X2 [Oppia nitens]|nr:protein O-mannosyl-transferase Tmtc3-like isoform X2 [Oppia nitens]
MGYHIINVILHVIVCLIYNRLCNLFMPSIAALISTLSFSVHPIHTEAVTSVVGRAETLSSIFFLLAFLAYVRATKHTTKTEWMWFLLSITLVSMATLCKEQGITAIAICGVYEVFIVQKLKLSNLVFIAQNLIFSKALTPSWLRESFLRLSVLFATTCIIIMTRLRIMGSQLPVFTKFDNPAAAVDTPVRQLTYNFLLAMNSWLMLFPNALCCDWTMGTIPLIETYSDIRNVGTIVFYMIFCILVWKAFTSSHRQTAQVLIISLAFIVFPFLPASNLFFPVGFVIAERILYMPSFGFCMLFGLGFYRIYHKLSQDCSNAFISISMTAKKRLLVCTLVFLFVCHSIKTIVRNYDWESEYTIFMAGIKINKQNAKLYNNVGHALEAHNKYTEALNYFLEAVRVQPDDIGAHMNVGRTYNNLHKYELSEKAFNKAKDLLPKPRPGERYQARIAPSHLNVFLNLANLIARNKSRLQEADALYRQAISMRADYTQAYINRGDVLLKLNRTREAQEVYEKALQFDSSNPDIYYNLGVVLLEQSKATQALVYFNKALELNPLHEQSLMNSAILIQESGSHELRPLAQQRLQFLIENGKANERVYFNLGMLSMDAKDYAKAEKWFRAAIHLKHDFRSATFNLALLLSDSNRPLEAVPFLKQLLKYHSNHIKGLILLGDIYINHVKDLEAAEECYKQIVRLDPNNIQGRHNLCVVYVEREELERAENCLQSVSSLAPNEEYISKHLRIVRNRVTKLREKQNYNSKEDLL